MSTPTTYLVQLSSQSGTARIKCRPRRRKNSQSKISKGIPIINFKKDLTLVAVVSNQHKNRYNNQIRQNRSKRATPADWARQARILAALCRVRRRRRRASFPPHLKACWPQGRHRNRMRTKTPTLISRRLSDSVWTRRRKRARARMLKPTKDPMTVISGSDIHH